jgi:hypothetical protein
MLNASKHFIKRWVTRIGEIDEKDADAYISKNRDKIVEHANKTFDFADFLYKGQIGDNVTRNYYIKDSIVFVTNVTNDALVTVYRVDMGFPSHIQSNVIKGLLEEIRALNVEKAAAEQEMEEKLRDKEHDAAVIDDEIAIAEQRLKALKEEREFNKLEQANIKKASLNVGLELKRYTLMLVNSKELKQDLQAVK